MGQYKSKAWRQKAEAIRRRDGYQCVLCRRYGKVTPGNTVHHIYPAKEYPELFWNEQNLITLCPTCHEKMHERKTGRVTQEGERLQQRMKHHIFKNIPPSSQTNS